MAAHLTRKGIMMMQHLSDNQAIALPALLFWVSFVNQIRKCIETSEIKEAVFSLWKPIKMLHGLRKNMMNSRIDLSKLIAISKELQ
ncbi:hypothetical protein [Pectobacterium sp. B1J-3]|uniref:hypothetical protein n=1 Tax=Pectobacterium sp. B1J-3 TaxID=3385371 RepID=UPI003906A108